MSSIELHSSDVRQTRRLGAGLGRMLRPGDCLALIGPLGAGKTAFVQGLAEGAQVADLRQVTSPTFVIVNEYAAQGGADGVLIQHIDAYRLRDGSDLESLGFDEMLTTGSVVIEWADKVVDILPPDHLAITFVPQSPVTRLLCCRAHGPRSRELLAAVTGEHADDPG